MADKKQIQVQVRWKCPESPWFCDLERAVEDLRRILGSSSSGLKYELEARVGTLHPETQKFVPGLLQSDGDLLLSRVFPVHAHPLPKWERIQDIHYEGGYRRRNGGPLIKKKVLKTHTFLAANGFAFRLAISTETEVSMQDEKLLTKQPETMRRDRMRWSKLNSTKEWQYDFTFNSTIKQMEVEIEAVPPHPDKVWDLAFRMCHLIHSLRTNGTDDEILLSNGSKWPIHCAALLPHPTTA